MEFTGQDLQNGLPHIHEAPNCSLCHAPKAFVVSSRGIICGNCYLQNQSVQEDAIIREASNIIERRGDYAA